MNETGGFASLPHGRFAFVISSRRVSQAKTNCQLILLLFEKDFDDFTISFNEENVINEKDEYMIEVFKYDYTTEDDQEKVTKTKLYFDNEQIDDKSVYWYFNITTDDNVQKNNFTFVDEPVEILKVDDECVYL